LSPSQKVSRWGLSSRIHQGVILTAGREGTFVRPEAARVRFYMASLIHAQIMFALRLYGEVVGPSFEVDRTMHLALVLMVVLAMLASRLRREAGRASGRRRHDLVRRYSSGSHPVDARRES
jgi:hypothetical protein